VKGNRADESSEYSVVTACDTRQEARQLAATLVGEGIGAAAGVEGDHHEVRVLTDELERARVVLGLVDDDSDDDDGDTIVGERAAWKIILPIWLVAMIVIPLAAYWITVTVLGG
jgi:hypothetical protein